MNKQLTKFEKQVFECIPAGKEHPISQRDADKSTRYFKQDNNGNDWNF